ncbi:unnamed protein product [Vicia faba]|uniref:Uncharacterized protein n=1 Tax=Vicia faba TaxID=3906 RepID=A0AAV0Z471_VICFA|nr:unnamed protein product [Vicia faba]
MKGCKTQVKIHTLGTHSWRRIQDFPPCMVPCGEPGITVSRTVNWFAYSDAILSSSQAIVSLDLETESYRQISQSDYGIQVNLTLVVESIKIQDMSLIDSEVYIESLILLRF